MLTEQEARAISTHRTWVVLPAMIFALGAVFLYFIGLGYSREHLSSLIMDQFGETVRDITEIALIFPSFAIFLIPSCLAAKYAGHFKLVSPSCNEDVTSGTNQILSTRCCPGCNERILYGGRTHHAAVYRRYLAIWSQSLLRRWLWALPALAGMIAAG